LDEKSEGERSDKYLMCDRCTNLDAITGKSPLTILAHLRETRGVVLRNAKLVNKTPSYHPRRPYSLLDPVGMGVAVDMLLKSITARGRIKDHVQFSTIRKIRATHTKNFGSCLLCQGLGPNPIRMVL
jgi:hypothetical protein